MSKRRVVVRYRGDGRAITREVEDFEQPLRTQLGKPERYELSIDLESRAMDLYKMSAVQRRVGKTALFGYMYGMGTTTMNRYQKRRMFEENGGMSGRHPKNGPFKVVPYTGATKKKHQHPFKVVNKNGYRIHRGSKASCDAIAERLNIEVAKLIMVSS